MFKHRGLLIIFLCLIFASILGFFMFANNTPKAQNLFTYKDIAITQEQNIKTLMSAGGNVVIDSNIKGHIFVVDGDLVISNNSKVSGRASGCTAYRCLAFRLGRTLSDPAAFTIMACRLFF